MKQRKPIDIPNFPKIPDIGYAPAGLWIVGFIFVLLYWFFAVLFWCIIVGVFLIAKLIEVIIDASKKKE